MAPFSCESTRSILGNPMAGDRHHYLPKFLQAGFASKKFKDRVFTWVYRKDKPPFECNTRHVGVEQGFYSRAGDETVDKAITDAEASEFAQTIHEARLASHGSVVTHGCPRLFAHLEVRSRSLRQNFQNTSEQFWNEMLSSLERPGEFARLLQRHINERPDSLRRVLQEAGLSEGDLESAEARMKEHLPAAISNLSPQFSIAFGDARAKLSETLAGASKTGHLNALATTIAPDLRIEAYQELSFIVVDIPTADLVLGDCGVIFHVSGPKPFKSFGEKKDDIAAAILPITAFRALVGFTEPYELDPTVLRRAIARCSHEFFISNQRTNENDQLVKEIGLDTAPLSRHQISSIAQTVLEKAGQSPAPE